MMHYGATDLQDTIAALATPPGIGALGIIRVSGPKAIEIVDQLMRKDLAAQPSHTVHFGMLRDENGHTIDEVLATIFKNPRSYTGEDTVELSCHGSPYIRQEALQLLVRQGARLAKPGEFTLRAFLNGKLDLSQAEAVADLIASSGGKARDLALQQMRGGFSKEIQQLRQELIHFASLIELELDFGEEDVEFADRSDLRALVEKLLRPIRHLLQSFQLGNVIKNGVTTVLAGRPNAGKSTLLNALLNEERAIVSDIAGTTRDTIEEVLHIRGIPFRLIDTAGIREAQDQIEAIGVQRTMEKIEQAALLVYVFDVLKTKPETVKEDLAALLKPGMQLLAVANKMDLNPYTLPEHYTSEQLPADRFVPVAALHGMNIPYLQERLYEAAVGAELQGEGAVVSNARHYEALQRAGQSLEDVLNGLHQGITGDFLAMDIRRALHYLGEITGEITTEDLLDNIFSKFCIGK